MTKFEAWGNLCNKNNCNICPISVAKNYPNTGLYMTKSWYWDSNHRNIYYNSPVYQIWFNDERELVTQNSKEAIIHWLNLVKELNLERDDYEQII